MYSASNENKQRLFKALISLSNEQECEEFCDDIFTIQEFESIAQRLEIAEKILQGMNYKDINLSTGASTATICRVGKCIKYGNGGYKKVLDNTEVKDD